MRTLHPRQGSFQLDRVSITLERRSRILTVAVDGLVKVVFPDIASIPYTGLLR